MPYAQVLTTASVASATGGTFADTLAAVSGDSLAVANFGNGSARIIEAWGEDSAHVAELQVFYTRPQSTHDQQHGWRTSIQAAAFNATGKVKEVALLGALDVINLYRSDTPTIQATSTASDCVVFSYLTEYDDLPGASATFISPTEMQAHHASRLGIRVSAVASGTAGALGATRAFNADDDRLHANRWYAIVGLTVQSAVTSIYLTGPDFGGQRIGLPAGSIQIASQSFYLDQSVKWNKPLIPIFNSNNKGNTLVAVVDSAASTSPQIDFQLVELDYPSNYAPISR